MSRFVEVPWSGDEDRTSWEYVNPAVVARVELWQGERLGTVPVRWGVTVTTDAGRSFDVDFDDADTAERFVAQLTGVGYGT